MKPKEFNSLADLWKERYEVARKNQSLMHRRFSHWFDLMNASINVRNYAPWRSKVFIPILASKAWDLASKFVGLQPGFEVDMFEGDDYSGDPLLPKDLRDRADKMERMLEHDYDNPLFDEPMREKMIHPLLDAIITGTGIAKVPRTFKTQSIYKHPLDPQTEKLNQSKVSITDRKVNFNDLIPVNIFNVFVAPGAGPSIYKAPWIIIREWTTWSKLNDINKANGVDVYKNLNLVKNMRSDSDEDAEVKKARNRLPIIQDPIQGDDTIDQFEIFECYSLDDNKLLTFATGSQKDGKNAGDNTWIEIRNQNNIYWHGKYPLVKFQIKQRAHDFWGQGIFELAERLQAGANDVFNHYMDNWNLGVDGMLMVNEDSEVFEYTVKPGGHVNYSGQAPTQFKFPEPNPQGFTLAMNTINAAIEEVTINQYASGNTDSATDKTQGTATGIIRLQEAASDIIGFMRSNFQTSIHQVGTFWMWNNQQFQDTPVKVKNPNPHAPEPITIYPEELQGLMYLRIDDASMQPMSKQDRLNKFNSYIGSLTGLQKMSFEQAQALGTPPIAFDFAALSEETAHEYGEKRIDKVMMPHDKVAELHQGASDKANQVQMLEMAGKMGLVGGPGQPGGPAPAPEAPAAQPNPADHPIMKVLASLGIKMEKLPEDVQQQLIKQIFGIESTMPTPTAQGVALDAAKTMIQSRSATPPPAPLAVDQHTSDIAHNLVAGGHVDPSIIDALKLPAAPPPALPGGPELPTEAEPVTAGVAQ